MSLRSDADQIIRESIKKVLPDEAVTKTLRSKLEDGLGEGNIYVISIGKAAWQMANAAYFVMKNKITSGIVITKYGHVSAQIPGMRCFEAGHPVPDDNTYTATEEAIKLVSNLSPDDTVLFLVSGGGSALFEKPLISAEEMSIITNDLLACGAEITEINTIRKRLSAVKGGRFAKLCKPAKVFSIVLSDILGNPLDMIASGPAYPDSSTCNDAMQIIDKYGLRLSPEAMALIGTETPKILDNVETIITGSVTELCQAAQDECMRLGYETVILTDQLSCEAREAGSFLASIAKTYALKGKRAFIAGGETVVHITGKGKGGRNQEIALSAAEGIAGMKNVAVFSIGSDGTDGPTDAAGGYADGCTKEILSQNGLDIYSILADNDSYNALNLADGLIVTGPTGTNVNDVAVILIQ